jgi:hypothetical protein
VRAICFGMAMAAFIVTPSLADYYIVQDPTTKRCRIVQQRPAAPVQIGANGFAVRRQAESYMRTVEKCRGTGATTNGSVRIDQRERVIRERK